MWHWKYENISKTKTLLQVSPSQNVWLPEKKGTGEDSCSEAVEWGYEPLNSASNMPGSNPAPDTHLWSGHHAEPLQDPAICPLQNGNYWCLLPLAAVRKKPLSGAWDTEAINRCLWFAYYCCCYHYDCNIINRVNLIFKKSFCFNLSSHIWRTYGICLRVFSLF